MSDPDQEEMRRKRLARLSGLGATSPAQGQGSSSQSCTSPQGESCKSPSGPGPGLSSGTSTSSLGLASPGKESAKEGDSPPGPMEVDNSQGSLKGGASQLSLDNDSGIENMEVDEPQPAMRESQPRRNRTTSTLTEASEEQVRGAIQNIFNVTIPGAASNARPGSLDIRGTAEMIEQGVVTDHADIISSLLTESIVEFSQASSQEKVVKHLVSSYSRISDEEREQGRRCQVPPLSDVLSQSRQQIVSHLCHVLQGTLSSASPISSRSPLYPVLVGGEAPQGLLHDLVQRLSQDQEALSAVIGPLLQHCNMEMRKGTVVESKYKQPLLVLVQLCDVRVSSGCRPVCDLLPKVTDWLPTELTRAGGLEMVGLSFLGPFLSPSVFPEEDPTVAEKYFEGKVNASEMSVIRRELQQDLDLLRTSLHKLFYAVVANSGSREAVLSYIQELLSRNHKRQQLQVDERRVAGDGFMLNVMSVLQLLSGKVRQDKVDPAYLHHPSCRLVLRDEARIRATAQEAEEFASTGLPAAGHRHKDPNFPTECWFLTLQAHHIGVMPIVRRYQRRLRALRELQKMVDDLEKSEHVWRNHPSAARNRTLVKKWKHQIKKQSKSKQCADVGLLDEALFTRCQSFYSSVAEHMLRLLEPSTPLVPKLPLATEPPQLLTMLPEWVVDDLADFLLFGLQFLPQVVSANMDHTLVTWLLVCVCHPHYFSNPYLVSKLIEVLFVVNPAVQEKTATLYSKIMGHPICEEHLPSALMRFYTDVEQTGSSNEFYDKFTIRYHISIILKSMWDSSVHKMAIISESTAGKQFIRFINMMINDITFLLDESLDALKRIHEVQEDMADPAKWAGQNQETQTNRARQLNQDERQCRSYLTLARETVDMFHYLTQDIVEPFLRPELADRLAAMLDCNLEQLTNGPKCKNLKVKNPEKYGWDPKWLLSHIIDIYLHLDSDKLAQAIANDQRCFKIETFQDTARRMETVLKRTITDTTQFLNLAENANKLVIERIRQEDDWDDIPDEFEDAIMGEIMDDPVILPTSGKVMDRKHITRHILSTPNDPFNREPLTEEMLRPATDLKLQIEEWKRMKGVEATKKANK